MKKFRIKVDLSAFFCDERKLAHILIDPTWENVKCLQHRVEQIFEVENVRFITNEGCFVPPQESIQVIKTNDILRAFVPTGDMKKKRKKEKIKNVVMVEDAVDEKLKKRKRELNPKETGFTSSTPQQAKRSKSILPPIDVPLKNNTVDEITSTNEQLGLKYGKQKVLSINIDTDVEVMETNVTENIAATQLKNVSIVSEESNGSAKKRRRQKNKNNQSLVECNDVLETSGRATRNTDATFLNKPSTSNAIRSCSMVRDESKRSANQKSHCYFNDTGETVSTTTEQGASEMPAKVIFRCPVSEVPYNKPRVFSLKMTESATPVGDNIVVFQESTRIKPKSPVIIEELVILPKLTPLIDQSIIEEATHVNETISYEAVEKEATENETDINEKAQNEVAENEYEEVEKETVENEEGENETPEKETAEKEISEKEVSENEIVNDDETDVEATKDQSDQDTTTADDSSVIAIESENEDYSIEEEDKDTSTEQGEEVSEIIDLNASDDESRHSSVNAGSRKSAARKQLSIREMLPFSIELEALPRPGEIIIFKLERLDRKRSGFIAGKCDYVNKRTKVIKLIVIDGKKEISGIPNKYMCPLDDSTLREKIYLQIKFTELLEAKLFSED